MRMVLFFSVIFLFSACLGDQAESKRVKIEAAFERASVDLMAVRIGISDQCILARYDSKDDVLYFDPSFTRQPCREVAYVKTILIPKESFEPITTTTLAPAEVTTSADSPNIKQKLLSFISHFRT